MHKAVIALIFMALSTAGHAQVHKCKVGARTVYQQDPCPKAIQAAPKRAAASGAAAAPTQLPWPGVEYGMSRAEVLRLVAGSREGRGDVRLEGFRYGGRTFDVEFRFKSDRLTQVHLSDAVFMQPNAATRQAFEQFAATLRQTYGKPFSQSVDEGASGLQGEAVWRKGGAEITLAISPTTQDQSTILFNFFAKGKRRAP
ncbi:MAG: hypothetical protein FWG56_09330 [Desulfovibrionaceae bacterium]|nr:hypothetical protein [Desulfovibrionaceae bacterium]